MHPRKVSIHDISRNFSPSLNFLDVKGSFTQLFNPQFVKTDFFKSIHDLAMSRLHHGDTISRLSSEHGTDILFLQTFLFSGPFAVTSCVRNTFCVAAKQRCTAPGTDLVSVYLSLSKQSAMKA